MFITGFLGLVIGLGVLSIVAGVGAWFLWRRHKQNKNGGGFPKASGFFRKKNKGWMQTQSYTDGDEEDDGIRLNQPEHRGYPVHANQSTASVGIPARGRPYDDPFNAQSLDNLQRETSTHIDKGPEYHRVNTTNVDHPPHQQPRHSLPTESPTSPTFAGGTKFKEGL
jgi:hypothetical protein